MKLRLIFNSSVSHRIRKTHSSRNTRIKSIVRLFTSTHGMFLSVMIKIWLSQTQWTRRICVVEIIGVKYWIYEIIDTRRGHCPTQHFFSKLKSQIDINSISITIFRSASSYYVISLKMWVSEENCHFPLQIKRLFGQCKHFFFSKFLAKLVWFRSSTVRR